MVQISPPPNMTAAAVQARFVRTLGLRCWYRGKHSADRIILLDLLDLLNIPIKLEGAG